jgi:L-asparaginase II
MRERLTGSSSARRAASTSGNSGIVFLLVDAINVAVTRGDVVEAVHRVHAVVVRDGRVAESWGDPGLVAYVRSAAKPLQALPLVPYELPPQELAIACASHEALPDQLVAVRALLGRAGATVDDLECGAEHGSRLKHNCSGKHAGFLFLCRARGWEQAGYRLLEHPVQREVLALLTAAVAREPATAVDGCGVPTFALTLVEMAGLFAGLVRGEPDGSAAVAGAMTANPRLVGGPQAVDTLVMRGLPGAVAKRGAEGLLCAGLPDGTGVALKVEDGANRAAYAAAGVVLGLPELDGRPVRSSRGEVVGAISARPNSSTTFPQPL